MCYTSCLVAINVLRVAGMADYNTIPDIDKGVVRKTTRDGI
jgi:hypothetical protein